MTPRPASLVWFARHEAGLMWRDVAMLRAYSRYLRQIRVPYSQDYMWATLVRHMSIARLLVQLFHSRHNPEKVREHDVKSCLASIEAAAERLADVPTRKLPEIARQTRARRKAEFDAWFEQQADRWSG